MSAPTWEQYMAPSLRVLANGQVHRLREVTTRAAEILGLTEEQQAILIPSGQEQWINRGNWALSYLNRAGATERPGRGRYRITPLGRELLERHPDSITLRDLQAVPNWPGSAVAQTERTTIDEPSVVVDSALDPTEQIEFGIKRIHEEVAEDLLKRLHAQDPAFFEQAVLDLMIAMGYGGSLGKATRTQLSNDGGIDGVIDQDALGLNRIYVQAKRYAPGSSVRRPEVQGFAGALQGQQADRGVFITTGTFSPGARGFAKSLSARLVLIDGDRLAELMIRHGVGVQTKRVLQIVEVDEDFFE